jgi:hypothetical protein
MTTYREQRGLPPWFPQQTPPPANLPPMEPLQPNPRYRPQLPPMEPLQPNPRYRPQPASQAAKRQPPSRKGPGHKGPGKAALQAQAYSQPRDDEGRFAEKGGWFKNRWNAWLDPTPRPPTRLNKKRPARAVDQRSFSEVRTAAPMRKKAKRRKKPVPQRGFVGRVVALFNGDYSRWRMANLRQQARLRMQAEGYYAPKKRARRRKPRPAQPPPRRRGLSRFLPF